MDLFKKFPDLLKKKMPVLTETRALFSLGIQLMQLFSENKADFTKLTGILGLYYQISNDYRNLCWQEVISELLVLNI
jgi:geranylgeranyl diphosphate synthase type 3